MITTTYSLVEICKIRSGKRLPKGCDFSEAPTAYKYIRARDIKNGTIDGSDLVYISEEVQSKIKKYIVNTKDIVITIVGASVGDVAYVASEFDGMNLTENAVRLTEFAPYVNSKYLMYILNSLEYWELMQQIAGGAAQPKLGIYKIEAIKVHLPPKEVQDRIVDILCTYDDLIENNQKQIKLLEEAAQRLYKEWFVDLRFPGHETTPITDGIPKGWTATTIGDETEVRRGGSPRPIQEYLSDEGLNWLKISDATASNSPFIYQIKERIKPEGLKKTVLLKAGTIVLSNSATPGIPKILKIDTCIHDGWLYFPNLQLSNEYMYHLFLQIRSDLVNRGTGAVFTNLRTDILKEYRFIKPDDHILELFNKQVKPIFSKIDCLHQQVLLLIEARDRLLPKLMNGEIEV